MRSEIFGTVVPVGVAVLCVTGTAACGEASSAAPWSAAPPTYSGEVAAILHARCASCHRPEGPAHFALLDYEAAAARAPRIAEVVEEGLMPPWLPGPADVEYEAARGLDPDEVRTLRAWADAGAPPGDLDAAPEPPPPPAAWPLGPPDLVVEMDEPFAVPATGRDLFRNFVLPLPVERRRWVRGADVRFHGSRVVHHAMLTIDETSSSRRMDDRDPGPGFDGMFASIEALSPPGFVLGWTPGREPALAPADFAWPLEPGTDLVLQAHLRPTGEEATLRATVGLYFADGPPARSPFLLRLGSQEIDIPAGDAAYPISDAYELPVAVEVLGIYPHAHYLGRRIELDAVRPDGRRLRLLRIEDWNFDRQDAYRLAEPLALPEGSRLEARIVYDNSASNPRNPSRPPERVVYGPTSTDEMGDVWVQVVPARPEDLPTLAADYGRKEAAAKLAGWRHTLRVRPRDPVAHVGLGTWAQAAGRHEEAVRRFRAALDEQPDYLAARYNLALSLEELGRPDEAARAYRAVLAEEPRHADARNNLATLLARAGRLDEAVAHWRAGLEAAPESPEIHSNLGNALRQIGERSAALRHLRRAVELEPDHAEAHANLGLALVEDDPAGAVDAWARAAELRRGWPLPLGLAAWTLATHADPAVRDPATAVRHGEEAVRRDGARDPRLLDALAAAYASAGRFEEAAATQRRALERARAVDGGGGSLIESLRGRLALYEAGRPYREGR